MTTPKEQELLPCGCGGKAEILNNKSGGKDASDYPVGTIIGCATCGLQTGWYDGYYEPDGTGKAKATKCWNDARPTPTPANKEAEELRTQLEAWHTVFGTTQLTHAKDRLDVAERKAIHSVAPQLVALDEKEVSRFIGDYLQVSNNSWRATTFARKFCATFGTPASTPAVDGQALADEKATRIKYQDIVYKICKLFDNPGDYCTIEEVVNKVKEVSLSRYSPGRQEERIKELEEALESLTDDEACSLDHHGYCQTHFSGSAPCVMAEAKRVLKCPTQAKEQK